MKKIKFNINWNIVFIVSTIIFATTWPLNYKNFDDLILRCIVSLGVLILGIEIYKTFKIMNRIESKIQQ